MNPNPRTVTLDPRVLEPGDKCIPDGRAWRVVVRVRQCPAGTEVMHSGLSGYGLAYSTFTHGARITIPSI